MHTKVEIQMTPKKNPNFGMTEKIEEMSQKRLARYYEKAFDRLEKTGKHIWD